MLAYALVALSSALATYFITRYRQKAEIKVRADKAYSQGFDDCRDSTLIPVVVQEEDMAPWERPGLFKEAPAPEPAPEPVYVPEYTAVYNTDIMDQQQYDDARAQAEVDQFCEDMDRDSQLFIAHMEADGHRARAYATRDFRDAEMTSPIPAIIAREVITREVIVH